MISSNTNVATAEKSAGNGSKAVVARIGGENGYLVYDIVVVGLA
jgi:hypothetical protein